MSALALGACNQGDAQADPESAASAEETAAVAPPAEDEHALHAREAERGPRPIRENGDGSRLFGSEMDAAREVTPLATVIDAPARFAGQTVKTEGVISQVCQRMGCWMELRPTADDGPAVRVPMAGHSFFLPRDVAGRPATVEGTVEVHELDDATRDHLREEGAQATAQPVSIAATAVLVR